MKNLVIEEAMRLGGYTEVFAPSDGAEQEPSEAEEDAGSAAEEPQKNPQKNLYRKYRDAKRILASPDVKPEQAAEAVAWLTQAAEAGLDYAQYALGKLYRDGGPVERDMTRAAI